MTHVFHSRHRLAEKGHEPDDPGFGLQSVVRFPDGVEWDPSVPIFGHWKYWAARRATWGEDTRTSDVLQVPDLFTVHPSLRKTTRVPGGGARVRSPVRLRSGLAATGEWRPDDDGRHRHPKRSRRPSEQAGKRARTTSKMVASLVPGSVCYVVACNRPCTSGLAPNQQDAVWPTLPARRPATRQPLLPAAAPSPEVGVRSRSMGASRRLHPVGSYGQLPPSNGGGV